MLSVIHRGFLYAIPRTKQLWNKDPFQNRSEGTINGCGDAFMTTFKKFNQTGQEQSNVRKAKSHHGHATQQ